MSLDLIAYLLALHSDHTHVLSDTHTCFLTRRHARLPACTPELSCPPPSRTHPQHRRQLQRRRQRPTSTGAARPETQLQPSQCLASLKRPGVPSSASRQWPISCLSAQNTSTDKIGRLALNREIQNETVPDSVPRYVSIRCRRRPVGERRRRDATAITPIVHHSSSRRHQGPTKRHQQRQSQIHTRTMSARGVCPRRKSGC